MNETAEEIKLISSILQRLVNNSDSSPIRKDHLQPLISRLDTVSLALNKKEEVSNEPKGRNALAGKEGTSAAGKEKKSTKAPAAVSERRDKPTLKPPSLLARPVPREKTPQDGVLISKEVSKAFSCTLYNALESVTRLTDSKSAHIFVRRGDEMLSIANVGVNLSFPPQLVHHNCLGSVDTDVLSSGISLNRAICNGAHSGAVPLLIFPIYPKHLLQQVCETPIAVLHLEKRLGDSFTAVDETFCYSASNLIGEMLSRVDGMEWTDHFYDPVTQHIVAPFAPTKLAKLPKLATAGTKEADLLRKIEATAPEVLIRRDVLPASASGKSLIQGLSATPTLREVSVYLENMQNSWRKGITSTVDMTEEERSMTAELKVVRHQLKTTEAQLTKANEQLRLYQLNTDDYKSEYGHLRNELTNYMSERDER